MNRPHEQANSSALAIYLRAILFSRIRWFAEAQANGETYDMYRDRMADQWVECSACDGYGYDEAENTCERCGGDGAVRASERP